MKVQCKSTLLILGALSVISSLTGCGKYYLSLTQQNIDVNYLASTHVQTPDPRQAHPPAGEMIVMDWRVPKDLLKKKPVIDLHVLYWNYTEKVLTFPIKERMGYVTYKDLDQEYAATKGILTYKADIRTEDGAIFREWKHQLWVNLITLDENNTPTHSELSHVVASNAEEDADEEEQVELQVEENEEEGEGTDLPGQGGGDAEEEEDEDETPAYDSEYPAEDEDTVRQESKASEERISSFVDVQLRQASVTETEGLSADTSSERN